MATENKKPFNPASLGKVVVLLGGRSSEREVSLMSGKGVFDALKDAGVDVHRFDPQEQSLSELERGNYDRAVISLHGRYGEDGTMQGILEFLGIPYTGPGVRSSSIAIDKSMTKRIWSSSGIPVPNGLVVHKDSDMEDVIRFLGTNLVVKPAHEGSSIGLTKLENADAETLREAVEKASILDPFVLVEERIYGRELTVAVLGPTKDCEALPVIEIIAPEGDYDYQNKYFTSDVCYECPAQLSEELSTEIRKTCERAYRVLGGRGWSRIDVMVRDDGQFVLLEMNTSPGMTSHSLVPMAAQAVGLSYQDLVLKVAAEARLDQEG